MHFDHALRGLIILAICLVTIAPLTWFGFRALDRKTQKFLFR